MATPTLVPQRESGTEERTDERHAPDLPWVTVVWNDPINLMTYVTHVFMKVFGYSEQKAQKLMLDVHEKGRAIVSSGPRERMEVHEVEAELLRQLIGDLENLIAEDDDLDPVIKRLYPDGYSDDPEASAEFRDLVESGLRTERLSRTQACLGEIPDTGGNMELDEDASDRWLRVLNDVRIAVGTRIGVSEDAELDPQNGAAQVYQWLTEVQALLVDSL
jgi:ATP-dependent Clp protease adaptor protein ClpS